MQAGSNWLIVGLGNPGPEYARTRHNAGFMVVDELATRSQTQVKRTDCRSLVGRAVMAETIATLVKPQTFMNLSGEAVKCLLAKDERTIERLIVISDDLALPFGTIRIRPRGSHGGQNGLRSIIDLLKTNEFTRLRVGIGPDHPVSDASRFVLEEFSRAQFAELAEILPKAADAVEAIIRTGVEAAMAEFN